MALAIILFTVDERSPSPLTLLPPRGVRGEVVGTFAGVWSLLLLPSPLPITKGVNSTSDSFALRLRRLFPCDGDDDDVVPNSTSSKLLLPLWVFLEGERTDIPVFIAPMDIFGYSIKVELYLILQEVGGWIVGLFVGGVWRGRVVVDGLLLSVAKKWRRRLNL